MNGDGNGHVNGGDTRAQTSPRNAGTIHHVKKEGGEQATAAALSPLQKVQQQQQQPASLLRKPTHGNGSPNGIASSSKGSPLANGAVINGTTASHAEAPVLAAPTFDPIFRPRSIRSWEKSRRLDDEQQQPVPTRAELEEQLRPEEEGLVPLSAIAGRVVHYAWQLFANQAEINPSISPLERRKRIYDDAHEARKQLIKLLVLAQWSKSAPELHTARNLIGLINDHFVQTDAAVSSLEETRATLNNARLRRYDLPTAVDVLSNGEPQSIPPAVRQAVQGQKPFSDAQAIQLVHELDDVLRFRLASRETLPMAMSKYTIADGRACFVATDLFEADLTVSGDRQEDRWWLLRVKFDFEITGDGVDRFPKQPRSQQRLQILSLADGELAPRSIAAATSERGEGEAEDMQQHTDLQIGSDPTDDTTAVSRRDMPLVRLYNLLQTQCLLYRLNILQWQATQLCRFGWANCAQVILDGPRSVSIKYWQRPATAAASRSRAKQTWNPVSSGQIVIKVESEEDQEAASVSVFSNLFASKDDHVDKPQKLSLVAEWELDSIISRYVSSSDVSINHRRLNAEELLESVTKRHALAAANAFQNRLETSVLARSSTFKSRVAENAGAAESKLLVTLYEGLDIELAIQSRSGQLSLAECRPTAQKTIAPIALEDFTSSARFQHIKKASQRLNDEPHAVVTILQDLRRETLLNNLEQQCRLAGLACTSKLPLRQSDLAQLGTHAGAVLFVSIPQHASFSLSLQIGDAALTATIVCANTFLEGTLSVMRIVGHTRLDWQEIVQKAMRGSALGKRKRSEEGAAQEAAGGSLVTTEAELRTLHSYCVAFIGYQKIEQQFRQRNVDCFYIAPASGTRHGEDDADRTVARAKSANDIAHHAIPQLCIRTSTVFGGVRDSGLGQSMVMRLRKWNDSLQCRAVFSVHANLQVGSKLSCDRALDGFDEVIYSEKKKMLVFTIADIGNCIDRLLVLWRRIERVLDLVKTLARCPKPVEGGAYRLDSFDLMHVRFTYDDNLLARVGWVQQPSGAPREGFYTLEFSAHQDDVINPHALLCSALQVELNRGHYRRDAFWPRFIALLCATLPIAKALYQLPALSETDADCPEVEVKSAAWTRLVFLQSYALDVRLVRENRFLLRDAGRHTSKLLSRDGKAPTSNDVKDEFTIEGSSSTSQDDSDLAEMAPPADSSGLLRPIPGFEDVVRQLLGEARERKTEGLDLRSANIGMTNALLVPWDATNVERLTSSAIAHIQKSLASVEA